MKFVKATDVLEYIYLLVEGVDVRLTSLRILSPS